MAFNKKLKDLSTGGPGFWMGVASIAGSIFFQPVGLVCGILGMKESKKAGYKNNFAFAGVIISSAILAIGTIWFIFVLSTGVVLFNKSNDTRDDMLNSLQEVQSQSDAVVQSAQEIIDTTAADKAQAAANAAAAQAAVQAQAATQAADKAQADLQAQAAANAAAAQATIDAVRARLGQ